jgi:hypothetical protein
MPAGRLVATLATARLQEFAFTSPPLLANNLHCRETNSIDILNGKAARYVSRVRSTGLDGPFQKEALLVNKCTTTEH